VSNDEVAHVGYKIFKWLYALVLIVMVPLLIYGVATFPNQADYVPDATNPPVTGWKNFADAKAAWAAQVKDLAQTFLLIPVLPLLGSVIGYIFGRTANQSSSPEPEPEKT
jgi:hypothetical protein